MNAKREDGIILPPAREQDPGVPAVARRGIQNVCVDCSVGHAAIGRAEIDKERGAFDAADVVARLVSKISFTGSAWAQL